MATMPLFVVCFLTKASLVIGIFHFHSKGYNIVNDHSPDEPTYSMLTDSIHKPLSFLRTEIHSVPLRNVSENVFSPSPNAAKNTTPIHSESILTNISAFNSSKRQRRWVTFPPNRRLRRPTVTPGSDGKPFQAILNSRRHILTDGHFQRSRDNVGPEKNGRNIWQRLPSFPVISLPNAEPARFRPFPESGHRPNGMRSNRDQRRPWSRFQPNPEPEVSRFNPNQESVRINPEPEFSGTKPFPEPEKIVPNPETGMVRRNPEPGRIRPNPGPRRIGSHFKPIDIKRVQGPERIAPGTRKPPFLRPENGFSKGPQLSLKKKVQVQFPQVDWSGSVPWPRQGRRQGLRQTPYPLFPWWQKRASTPSGISDSQPNLDRTENQQDTEDERDRTRNIRGDVVPDSSSCVALTPKGDCNFYRCFDQRHTCPVEQNFAYNVASYLCRRTENFLNFFDDKAKKYLRGVKRCQMEALVPTYQAEVATCAQIEAVGLDILTGGILPPSVNDVSCFFQNSTFCDVMEDPQNVQLMYDLYGGHGYTEYRVFIHFVKLIQKCSSVALESFNQRYAQRFMILED